MLLSFTVNHRERPPRGRLVLETLQVVGGGRLLQGPQVSVPEVERWSGGMDGMSAGQKRQRGSRSVDIFEFSAESQVGEGTYG